VAAIAAEPFIMSKGGCEPQIRAIYRRAGTAPTVAYEVRETATIVAMVGEGLGISVLAGLSLPAQSTRVRAVPFRPPVRRRLALAVPSLANASPAAHAFIREATRTPFRGHQRRLL
jgi:DNA-binding transcriptional LysR family regulator